MTTFEVVFKDGEAMDIEAETCKGNGGWLNFEKMVEVEVEEPFDRTNGPGVEMKKVMRPRPTTVRAVNLSEVRHYGPKDV